MVILIWQHCFVILEHFLFFPFFSSSEIITTSQHTLKQNTLCVFVRFK